MYIHARTTAESAFNEYNCIDLRLSRHPHETQLSNEHTNKDYDDYQQSKQTKRCSTAVQLNFSERAEGERRKRLTLAFSPCHWTGSLSDLPFIHNLQGLPPPFPPQYPSFTSSSSSYLSLFFRHLSYPQPLPLLSPPLPPASSLIPSCSCPHLSLPLLSYQYLR